MGKYAEKTRTPVAASRTEIEKTLKRYGADGFSYGSDDQSAMDMVMFRIKTRMIRIMVPHPRRKDCRSDSEYEREERRRWRVLLLVVKAKLELVESGLSSIEDEFMSNILMADGQTMGQWARPQLEEMYKTGKMPKLLPGA